MNFGDMSLRNLPTATSNLPGADGDQLPNHRPIYIDDECSTYQETRTESAWRATVAAAGPGTNSDGFPMNWYPTADGTRTSATSTGWPFSTGGTKATRQFTGHRVNIGLSYSKFAYDGTGTVQLNAQLSQWESTCRWCCHARPDTVCNIEMTNINSSPFSTKCGNSRGTRRDAVIKMYDADAGSESSAAADSYAEHDIATALKLLKTYITDETEALDNSNTVLKYWGLLSTLT